MTESETPDQWVTERQACRELAGVGLSRRRATKVLAARLAGEPASASRSRLYRADRVAALLAVRTFTSAEAVDRFPQGIFVGRRDLRTDAAPGVLRDAAASSWRMDPFRALYIDQAIGRVGALPFVATVCGFVVVGADLTGVATNGSLHLRPPGDWYAEFAGTRVLTAAGAPWTLLGWTDGWAPQDWQRRQRELREAADQARERRQRLHRLLRASAPDLEPHCLDEACTDDDCRTWWSEYDGEESDVEESTA